MSLAVTMTMVNKYSDLVKTEKGFAMQGDKLIKFIEDRAYYWSDDWEGIAKARDNYLLGSQYITAFSEEDSKLSPTSKYEFVS